VSTKRRYFAAIASTAVAGLVLAGCSGGDTEPTDSATDTGGEMMEGCEDFADYGTFDGGEVEVYTTITGVELGQLEETFTDFSSCTGITVNVVSSDEFETEINIRIEGGNPPDLAIIPQPGLLQTVVGSGTVVPAPESVEANVDEFWSEDWKGYGTVGQTFYAAPLMASVKAWP